jgi:integrase
LALIRSILIRARDEWEWIEKAPKIRLYKETNDRERALTNVEAKLLLNELPEHQRETVLFALATGLRQSNVVKLEWSRVNLELRHAWVKASNSKNGKPIAIPLNDIAVEILQRQIGKHSTNVFTYKGMPFKAANTKAWKLALKRAGIENFRWHDLRHTWATWQRQAGTPTHELQRLGGWKTSAMVERYAHLAPDQLAHAASRLNSMFVGYDLATLHHNEKRPPSLAAV